MSKFKETLTQAHKGILESRAALITADAMYAQEEIIRKLESTIRNIERAILNLSDLAPDSTFSLQPANGTFDATAWSESLQKHKVSLALKQEELKIAKETNEEYFAKEEKPE